MLAVNDEELVSAIVDYLYQYSCLGPEACNRILHSAPEKGNVMKFLCHFVYWKANAGLQAVYANQDLPVFAGPRKRGRDSVAPHMDQQHPMPHQVRPGNPQIAPSTPNQYAQMQHLMKNARMHPQQLQQLQLQQQQQYFHQQQMMMYQRYAASGGSPNIYVNGTPNNMNGRSMQAQQQQQVQGRSAPPSTAEADGSPSSKKIMQVDGGGSDEDDDRESDFEEEEEEEDVADDDEDDDFDMNKRGKKKAKSTDKKGAAGASSSSSKKVPPRTFNPHGSGRKNTNSAGGVVNNPAVRAALTQNLNSSVVSKGGTGNGVSPATPVAAGMYGMMKPTGMMPMIPGMVGQMPQIPGGMMAPQHMSTMNPMLAQQLQLQQLQQQMYHQQKMQQQQQYAAYLATNAASSSSVSSPTVETPIKQAASDKKECWWGRPIQCGKNAAEVAEGDGCTEVFESEEELQKHVLSVHVSANDDEATTRYTCKWKGCKVLEKVKGDVSRQRVVSHLRTHYPLSQMSATPSAFPAPVRPVPATPPLPDLSGIALTTLLLIRNLTRANGGCKEAPPLLLGSRSEEELILLLCSDFRYSKYCGEILCQI